MAEPRNGSYHWDSIQAHLSQHLTNVPNSTTSSINHLSHNSPPLPSPHSYHSNMPATNGLLTRPSISNNIHNMHQDARHNGVQQDTRHNGVQQDTRHNGSVQANGQHNGSVPVGMVHHEIPSRGRMDSLSDPSSDESNEGGQGSVIVSQGVKQPKPINLKVFHCKMCDQRFDTRANMLLHQEHYHKQDPKPYKCSTCSKSFANSSYLSQHSRIHSGVKPYKCDICDRKFTQLSHLQQHLRTHTGDKPYKCQHAGCGKAFSQLSNLQSHSRSHMTDKPYRCNSCYKCFTSENSLREHIPRHSDTKHFKTHLCTVCGKSYTQETYLVRHMIRHANSYGETRGRPRRDSLPIDDYSQLSPEQPAMNVTTKSSAFAPLTQNYGNSVTCNSTTHIATSNQPIATNAQLSFASAALSRYFPYEPINLRKMQQEVGLRPERDLIQRDSQMSQINSLIGLQQIRSYTAQHAGLPQSH